MDKIDNIKNTDLLKITNIANEEIRAEKLSDFLENNLYNLHEELNENDFNILINEIITILKNFSNKQILDRKAQKIYYEIKNYITTEHLNKLLNCFNHNLTRQIDMVRAKNNLFDEWKIQDDKCMLIELIKNNPNQEQLSGRSLNIISLIWNWHPPIEQEKFLSDFINSTDFNIGVMIWNKTQPEIKLNHGDLLSNLLIKKLDNIYNLQFNNEFKEWVNENIKALNTININFFDEKILKNISINDFKEILLNTKIQSHLMAYKENTPFLNYIINSLKDNKNNILETLGKIEKYQNIIDKVSFTNNPSNEEINSIIQILMGNNLDTENETSLNRKFEITNSNFELQIKLWETLPENIRNDNINILQKFIKAKFGNYLPENLDISFFENLNNSINLSQTRRINANQSTNNFITTETYINMLEQMSSPILKKEIMDIIPFEKMIQILPHKDIERKIFDYTDNPQILKLIEYTINNSSNWRMELNNLLNNMNDNKYYSLMENISDYKVEDLPIEQLVQVLKNSKNHFFIETIDDALQFNHIKTTQCINILEGNEPNHMSFEFNELNQDDKMKFALLELSFGIDIEEANELLKKYGTDIKDIKNSNNQNKINTILETLNIILSPDVNIQDFYLKNKDKLLNLNSSNLNFTKLETACLNQYANLYNDSLGFETENINFVNYNGTNIKVHETTGDFNILIRLEQNVDLENEATNFINKTFNNISLQLNGNCKTYIGQNFINFVQVDSDDVCLFGYTNCKENNLHYASSTNIKSGSNNVAFSPESASSDTGNVIKLRIPSKIIDNSRTGVNETTTQKWEYNSSLGKIEVDSPDFIVYVQETNDTDIEEDKRWHVAQMLATKLKKDILFIPREKCAQMEYAKLQELEQKISGDIKREKWETDEVLIDKLIVEFNNNREGIITSKKLSDKYFTNDQNNDMINCISNRLAYLKEYEPEKYEDLLPKVNQILRTEIDKFYATSYDRIDTKLDIDQTREHLAPYENLLMENEPINFNLSNDSQSELNSLTKNIFQTNFYDENEVHAIEHIEKVMLFSAILADNENLSQEDTHLLLVASAFHDSGRSGKDGDNEHAEASARQIEDYYKNNPNNPFNINMDNLPIIQTIIHYHEYTEPTIGKTDLTEIETLCKKYGVEMQDFEKVTKLCELLKDADALDRARFGLRSQNRWALNAQYLKSDTSKNINMIKFAEDLNLDIAKITATKYFDIENLDYLTDSQLAKIQIDTRTKHLPYEMIQQIFNNTLQNQISINDDFINTKQTLSETQMEKETKKTADSPAVI